MSTLTYEAENLRGEKILISPSSRTALAKVDTVVFDCDGVLIDVRRSYDAAIIRTASSMVKQFAGAELPLRSVGGELILSIRRTGGFNDDWETTYAITVFSVLALGSGGVKGALQRLRNAVARFSSRDRLKGRVSVDDYLEREGLESALTARLRDYVDYQVDPVHTRMTRAFDEMYYGGDLFQRIFASRPLAWKGEGLIEQERVLMTAEGLALLKKILGGARVAMATGRPFVAVQYTLGPLLRYFNQGASVYIGDGDIDPELAPRLRDFKKPSGASLIRAYEKLSSSTLLYVGDSAEDWLMVKDARRARETVLFAGIYGASFSEEDQVAYFTGNGSDLVAKSVRSVPLALERLRA